MTTVSATSTTTKISRFSKLETASATRLNATVKSPARAAFSRSPYREKTVMLRVPESLASEFRQRLDQYKQAVTAGDHDSWE